MGKLVFRTRKADANQGEIVSRFEHHGFSVLDIHTVGKGCPDLVVSRDGHTALVEVKDGVKIPSKRKLTDDEIAFSSRWLGNLFVIETQAQVDEICLRWPKTEGE